MNFLTALSELRTARCHAIRPEFNKGYLTLSPGNSPVLYWNLGATHAMITVNQFLGEWYTMTKEDTEKFNHIPGGV
jgi:hypothetical protein